MYQLQPQRCIDRVRSLNYIEIFVEEVSYNINNQFSIIIHRMQLNTFTNYNNYHVVV